MAKKQTRRSVSIRGLTYETVRKYCERHGLSMSEFVEERISTFFGNGQAAAPTVKEAPPLPAREPAARPTPAPVKPVVASAKPAPAPAKAAAPARPVAPAPTPAPAPARAPSPAAAAPAAKSATARQAKDQSQLNTEQLHDAARHFTF
ncbi:MAG: hypothetical protein IT371_27025 [Deltaproteobacteria bacterium]|nr:hypothetical protein [Deltaproteobacteria bacterium]